MMDTTNHKRGRVPFGCSRTPRSTPTLMALLKRESNMLSLTLMVLLALTYFFRDGRLVIMLAGNYMKALGGW